MGNFFGKSKKKEGNRTDSAPARLEGLDSPDMRPSGPIQDNMRPSTGVEKRLSLQDNATSSSVNQPTPLQIPSGPLPPERTAAKSTESESLVNGSQNKAATRPSSKEKPSSEQLGSESRPSGAPMRNNSSMKDDPAAWPKHVDVQLVVFLFGQHTLEGLTAKAWSDREASLQTIRTKLMQDYDRTAEDYVHLWKATTGILQKTIRDKVAPVYFTSLEVLRAAVSTCTKEIAQNNVHDFLDNIVPALIHRSGNLNPRISQASISVMCFLACEERVGAIYVIPFVLEAVKAGKNQNTALVGRLELLARLVDRCGLQGDLQPSTVLGFALPALETPDDKVRHAAVTLVVDVYLRNGKQLDERYLVKLKPALRKMLQRKIEEADGENQAPGAGYPSSTQPDASVDISGRGGDLPPLGGPAGGASFSNRSVLVADREPSGLGTYLDGTSTGGKKKKGSKTKSSRNGVTFREAKESSSVYTGYGPLEPAPARLKTPMVSSQPNQKYDYTGRVKTPLVKSSDQPQVSPAAPMSRKSGGKPPKATSVNSSSVSEDFLSRDEEDMMNSILES